MSSIPASNMKCPILLFDAALFEINNIYSFALNLFLIFLCPRYLSFKLVTWYETVLSLFKFFWNLLLYLSLA